MKRFWVSWWSELCIDAELVPFDYWVTGSRCSNKSSLTVWDDDNWLSQSHVALVDAESESAVWEALEKIFPDLEQRFIEERESDYQIVSDRFHGGKNRTALI